MASALAAASGLIPGSKEDFASPEFWRTFFERRGERAFEWYGSFPEFRSNLERAWRDRQARSACRTLVIGCGNSELSQQLYAAGWTAQTSIDFDAGVIAEMQKKYSPVRFPGLRFVEMDARALTFDASSFDLVVDKGTLDAMCTGDGEEVLESVGRMLSEVSRVLAPGGLYAVISLAQRHVLREILGHACSSSGSPANWKSLRIEAFDAPDHSSPLCPFIFLAEAAAASKRGDTCSVALLMPTLLPGPVDPSEREELSFVLPRDGASAAVLDAAVRAQLTYRSAQQLCTIAPGHYVELDVWVRLRGGGVFITPTGAPQPAELQLSQSTEPAAGTHPAGPRPRFAIAVVDASSVSRAGVLLVPQGREHEWSFGAPEGQAQLCGDAGFGRLLFVTMGRGHDFPGGLAAVQAELSPIVRRLVPPALLRAAGGGGVPFLAVAEDIGSRTLVAEGVSALSGAWVVEDIPWSEDMDEGAEEELAAADDARPVTAAPADAEGGAGASKARRKRDKKKKARARAAAAAVPTAVRRLVFMSNRNAVQSAARIVGGSTDPSWLEFSYHRGMVAAVAMQLAERQRRLRDVPVESPQRAHVLIIGLGGGALPTFLASQLSEVGPYVVRRSHCMHHLFPCLLCCSNRLRSP